MQTQADPQLFRQFVLYVFSGPGKSTLVIHSVLWPGSVSSHKKPKSPQAQSSTFLPSITVEGQVTAACEALCGESIGSSGTSFPKPFMNEYSRAKVQFHIL